LYYDNDNENKDSLEKNVTFQVINDRKLKK